MLRRLFSVAAAMLLIATGAIAFDMGSQILDIEGKAVQQDGVDLTLGKVAVAALMAPFPDEQNLAGEEKVKRFNIALKIQGMTGSGKQPDLTVEDLALIKKLVGKAYGPLVVGRVWELIDKR